MATTHGLTEKNFDRDPPAEVNPSLITFEGANAPTDPKNWPLQRKLINVGFSSATLFLMQMGSSIIAPALALIMDDLHAEGETVQTFVISIYVAGIALGPLVWGPASEIWGRTLIYNICNTSAVIMTVACGLAKSANMLLTFRFLTGCFGSVALPLGGGVVGDVGHPTQRGRFTSILAFGALTGPIAGPIVGGFLSERLGWRWCFWLMAILAGTISLVAIFATTESYPPIVLARHASALRRETGGEYFAASASDRTRPRDIFLRALLRPFRVLIFSPVSLVLACILAITFAYIYVLFSTVPSIFQTRYHFSSGISGLAYIAVGIGDIIGTVLCTAFSDRMARGHKHAPDDQHTPEARLPLLLFFTPLLPIGLLWYGWSAQNNTPWIVPELGLIPIGIGILGSTIVSQTYTVDVFTAHAASAMAGTTLLRSLAGAFIPLMVKPLYRRLGIGLGNTVLACLAVVVFVLSLVLWGYGRRLREKFPYDQGDLNIGRA